MVWKGSQILAKTKKGFRSSVWFLQINNEIVAYTFAVQYNESAFITKTSFDDRYKKCYVGKYINHAAIRDMFNMEHIETIDFMGDFPFMSFWTSLSQSHLGIVMWKGNFGKLMNNSRSNIFVLTLLEVIMKLLPSDQKDRLESLFTTLK